MIYQVGKDPATRLKMSEVYDRVREGLETCAILWRDRRPCHHGVYVFMTEYTFWKTYGKIENILSKYFEEIDGLEVFCYVVDSNSLNSPLAIKLWKNTLVLNWEIPASVWLTQEPRITAEEFILEYTFL